VRVAALAAALAVLAGAQTRTAEIEAARDAKEAALRPETVSGFENVLLQVKQRKILERLTAGYNGLRVQFGSMATGSGMAVGPQFVREDLASGRIRVDASAAISTRAWQKYQAGIGAPRLAGGRLALRAEVVRRDYRSLEFYGMGPDSTKGGRTSYRLEDTAVEGMAAFEPVRHVRAGASLGYLWTDVGPGKRDDWASAETVFTEAQAPGLTHPADFLRNSVFGQLDFRDNPLGPKAGVNYVVQHTWYRDRTLGAFNFGRWDFDAQHYIPFFNRTRRLALRARMTITDEAEGQHVPFYLRPNLGGSDDLRGFRPYRFTDRNAVVYNAEYRWEVFSGLDGAVFFDAGKVMPHRGWLAFGDLETSAGFGLRFNARNRIFLRLDVGFSHEGMGVWLKFNDPFLPLLFGTASGQPLY